MKFSRTKDRERKRKQKLQKLKANKKMNISEFAKTLFEKKP